jgi:hypothetical protein
MGLEVQDMVHLVRIIMGLAIRIDQIKAENMAFIGSCMAFIKVIG